MIYQIVLFFHLVGFALGFGGAMVSDSIFFTSISDKKITPTEFKFLRLGSRLVWLGLCILILSGIGLVYLNFTELMQSSKFLAKMWIVFIIALNGIFFHKNHIPLLKGHLNKNLKKSTTFKKESLHMIISGAISAVSWASAALLGSLPSVPLSTGKILLLYASVLCCGLACAVIVNWFIFYKT